MTYLRTLTTAVIFTLLTFTMLGCNIVSGNKSITVNGRRITQASLEQIEKGQTTTDWLEAAFGAPSSRKGFSREDGAGEVWRYDYRRTESSSGELLFIYDGWKHKEQVETTCFEIHDGRVMRYWTEKGD